MTPTLRRLAAWLALAAPGLAQGDADQKPKQPKKLAEWPKASKQERERIGALVGQFRKDNDELHGPARAQLIAMGDAAVPQLFQKVNDRDEQTNAQIFAVFDALLEPRHAALMAQQAVRKKIELRRYLVRRLCRFRDPDMAPILKRMTKDDEDDIAFYAWLGLLGLGDKTALDPVLDVARSDWTDYRDLIAEVCSKARSDDLGRAVAERIAKARTVEQAAGLRLMRYLATERQKFIVRGYLVAEDHGVKKAAINAMRVLSGMEPIENLSVFQAIEMAKEWQNK